MFRCVTVKNDGVTLDCHLTMKAHISNRPRLANFELHRVSSIRHLLSTDVTKNPCFYLCSFTPWLLQFSSVRLSSLSIKTNFKKFKTALLAFSWEFLILIISLLILLLSTGCHWFRNTVQIRFSVLQLPQPESSVYLTGLLTVYRPTRQLCSSSDTSVVCLPSACTHSLAQKSFSCAVLSGTVSLSELDHQTHSRLLNHHWNLTSSSYPID